MKTIHIISRSNHNNDQTWDSVQQNRIDNNVGIDLIHVDCSCGAQSLWSCESVRADFAFESSEMSVAYGYDIIECPSCATELQIAVINKYNSRPMRCLETWSRRIRVNGLHEQKDNIKYDHIPVNITEYKSFKKPGRCLTIDVDITEAQLYVYPDAQQIAEHVARCVYDTVMSKYYSPFPHSTPLHGGRRP